MVKNKWLIVQPFCVDRQLYLSPDTRSAKLLTYSYADKKTDVTIHMANV